MLNKIKVVEEIPTLEEIKKGQQFLISSNNVSYLTHTFHKYPGKFIPHVPRWGILRYLNDRKGIVFDPFCGSGTTLVEALLCGHNAYGIDIDPLSRLITKVKITPIEPRKLIRVCNQVLAVINKKERGTFVPSIPTIKHWFSNDAISKLSLLRDIIETYRDDKDIYDFLIIVFSSIIRKASNADNESQKTYVSHTNPKKPEDAFVLFKKNLTTYCERLTDFGKQIKPGCKAYVFEDCIDARKFSGYWHRNIGQGVDLAITSPPYIKAIDYLYNQMVELFWIGDLFNLENQKRQNEYGKNYIGTKRVSPEAYSKLHQIGINVIDKLIEQIYTKNKKHAFIVYKYFFDMEKNLRETYRILKNNAHYIVVVGNCNVSGSSVNTRDCLIEIARNIGFHPENLFSYVIRNRYMRFPRNGRGGLIEHDWILDLKK